MASRVYWCGEKPQFGVSCEWKRFTGDALDTVDPALHPPGSLSTQAVVVTNFCGCTQQHLLPGLCGVQTWSRSYHSMEQVLNTCSLLQSQSSLSCHGDIGPTCPQVAKLNTVLDFCPVPSCSLKSFLKLSSAHQPLPQALPSWTQAQGLDKIG